MSGPSGRIDAVLVCGGQWHDFDYARLQLLSALADYEHVRTRVFENYDCLEAIDSADLLITYTCNVVPDVGQQQALIDFVGRGGRWLALHGTNSAIEPTAPGSPSKYVTPRSMGELYLLGLPGAVGSIAELVPCRASHLPPRPTKSISACCWSASGTTLHV